MKNEGKSFPTFKEFYTEQSTFSKIGQGVGKAVGTVASAPFKLAGGLLKGIGSAFKRKPSTAATAPTTKPAAVTTPATAPTTKPAAVTTPAAAATTKPAANKIGSANIRGDAPGPQASMDDVYGKPAVDPMKGATAYKPIRPTTTSTTTANTTPAVDPFADEKPKTTTAATVPASTTPATSPSTSPSTAPTATASTATSDSAFDHRAADGTLVSTGTAGSTTSDSAFDYRAADGTLVSTGTSTAPTTAPKPVVSTTTTPDTGTGTNLRMQMVDGKLVTTKELKDGSRINTATGETISGPPGLVPGTKGTYETGTGALPEVPGTSTAPEQPASTATAPEQPASTTTAPPPAAPSTPTPDYENAKLDYSGGKFGASSIERIAELGAKAALPGMTVSRNDAPYSPEQALEELRAAEKDIANQHWMKPADRIAQRDRIAKAMQEVEQEVARQKFLKDMENQPAMGASASSQAQANYMQGRGQ